ncbi:hypothetical protein VM1G_11487 [Cytospora mali]|uniref:Uncharacterized protein n=1 Tax=Cytospora mali TaxID=578113 RepID=A0A194VVA7_CYTMA|nr:hypothetical protein VM1G_11487 [Valsa mali]
MESSLPPADEPPHFMVFPLEVRQQIYAELLCSFGEPKKDPETAEEDANMRRIDQVGSLAQTAILRTNRQIYEEAKEVMLKQNRFVRIFTYDIKALTLPGPIIVYTTDPDNDPIVEQFRWAVMSYTIMDNGDGGTQLQQSTTNFIILAKDLGAFLRALVGPENNYPTLPTGTEHKIVLHDPFRLSVDPSYDTLEVQKRLLQPFRDHFRGFTDVKIEGNVDNELAQTVLAEVSNEDMPDPQMFIRDVVYLMDEGYVYLGNNIFFKASQAWIRVDLKLKRLKAGKLWQRVKEEFGVVFRDRLADLCCTLLGHMAQQNVAEMQIASNMEEADAEMLSQKYSEVRRLGSLALSAGTLYEGHWQPSAAQRGHIMFRAAKAARFAGDIVTAAIFIHGALMDQPNDASFMQEATEIKSRE